MAVRDLIPWRRGRDVTVRRGEETNPFLTLHREMNRLFDDVFRGFDLAPFAADSGQRRGSRRIRGGRRRVREALYMAALAAVRADTPFRAFYLRLRKAGKSAKLALIAVARKLLINLNAMVRNNVAYQG